MYLWVFLFAFFLCYVLAYQLTIYTRLLRMQINIQMKRHVGQILKQGIRYLRGSFWIRSFFGYMPKTGITGLYGNSILHFWRNSHIIFIVAAPNYFPTNVSEGSLSFTLSPAFICRLFKDGHSDQCEVLPHCSFDLHVSNNLQCWKSFYVPNVHPYISLEKCLFWYSIFFKKLGCFCYWADYMF